MSEARTHVALGAAALLAAAAAGVYFVAAQREKWRRKRGGRIHGGGSCWPGAGEGKRAACARALVPHSLLQQYALG